MKVVSVHEAKTHLSRLIREVLAGGDVTIARGTEEVVKLVPAKPIAKPRRIAGALAHEKPVGARGILDNGFWDPLPDDELARWNGLVDDEDKRLR